MILLWIAMAVLAAAACVPLLVVLGRGRPAATEQAQALAVYRDQLDEVERDRERGVLAGADAEAARAEIARRLIRTSGAGEVVAAPSGRRRSWATAAVIAMPVVALIVYLVVGSPASPDEPLASRPDAVELQQVRQLVATVEQHLDAQPNDAQGWTVIAPIYQRLGRDADAVNAYQRVLDLMGPSEPRLSDVGEAMTQAAGGTVTPAAAATFTEADALDPKAPRPRFYLALALTQSGKTDQAKAAWQSLIADAPKDAAWLPAAEQQLAALGAPVAAPTTPGPTAADVAAAANMPTADQQQMIAGMVAGLADKLKTAPDDPDGWTRLIRSYVVLGRQSDATAALDQARAALASEPDKLASVEDAARQLGLTEATQ